MSTKPDVAANDDLDARYGDGTGFWVAALTTITSGAAGTVVEASGGAYARQSLAGILANAASRSKANDTAITFPEATTDHGNIVGWAIVTHASDAISTTNLKHVLSLGTPLVYNTGYQPVISIGDLELTEGAYA